MFKDKESLPIAVLAQQWEEARFLVDSDQTLDEFFPGKDEGELFFCYFVQRDPDVAYQSFKKEGFPS